LKNSDRGGSSAAAPLGERGRLFVVTRDEMRRLDAGTIACGTSGETLMERAGALAADVLQQRFRRRLRRGVLVVAGKGNNGGDAFVAARHLRRRGVKVEAFLAGRESDVAGDARTNLDRWKRARGGVREIVDGGLAALAERASRTGVIVDGLFGTGLRGALDERSQAIVEALNGAPAPILAVDVPSGLDTDRGWPLGTAVQATVTVTFGYPKIGLIVYPGAELAGEVVVADIGISEEALREVAPRQRLLTPAAVGAALSGRPRDSHKGSYGHLLVLAGALGKSGAAMLCGRASLRAGAGLTTIASPALPAALVQTAELMTEPLPEHEGGWRFADGDAPRLLRLFDGKDALVFGPGIGVTPATRALGEWLIASSPLPLVIDADGLNCLAGEIDGLKKRRSPVVLTPHPGEMARLLSCSVADVQQNRVECARRLAVDCGVTVALKGARTVIADPGGIVAINPTGNPGMASGGMGDALAGMIGALLAQGLEATEATEVAVFWHGEAADRVARERGEAGLLASDVIDALPPTLRDLQEDLFGDAATD
jgi:hydroxyethylthiazole kinase-like uncharacterized protein yjeF